MMGRLSTCFALAMGLSAFLLFWVQPLIGRWLLPRYGGAPTVWLSCLFFFQLLLLAGYAYAHGLARWLRPGWQIAVHGLLLACCLPLLPPRPGGMGLLSASDYPALSLLLVLAASVGVPAFALCATAPLMQHWFGLATTDRRADPYPLYAASNAGSLLAVLAAPMLLDAHLELRTQSWVWAAGFGLFLLAGGLCARLALVGADRRETHKRQAVKPPGAPAVAGERLRWLLLSFAPSSLLLATSYHLTVDLAPVPLLWMLPLGVYLATFIVAFSTSGRSWAVSSSPLALLSAVALLPFALSRGKFLEGLLTPPNLLALNLSLSVAALALLGLACHGKLAAAAPPPARLTEFYLYLSLGGVLGSAFNSLLAPVMFHDHVEYYIALAAAAWLLPARDSLISRCSWQRDACAAVGAAGLAILCHVALPHSIRGRMGWAALVCLAAWAWPVRFGPMFAAVVACIVAIHFFPEPDVLHRERTFFGIHRVSVLVPPGGKHGEGIRFHRLEHGTTSHGMQAFGGPEQVRRLPLTYYTLPGPVGQVFEALEREKSLLPVGVIGLGAGTLAAYGRPGQRFTFYEIDPAVERIARNPALFTFLQDSKAECKVVLGDARLRLEEAEDGEFGVLVIDAFSSDSIPVHLITSDAIGLYLSKLHEGGVIAFHITNRYLDLEPVLGNIARARSLACLIQESKMPDHEEARGMASSRWVLMARRKEALVGHAKNPAWKPARTNPGVGVWTDQFANVLSALK